MKLMLGCGRKIPSGWTGVDIDPSLKPEIVDDMSTLSKVQDETCEEIKSQHGLEHLLYEDAILAFGNWFRVLKPGGIVSMELPCLDKCHRMIQSEDARERHYGTVGLFGDIKSGNLFLIHKHGWSIASLTRELTKAGFAGIEEAPLERVNNCARDGYDRDMRIVARRPNA